MNLSEIFPPEGVILDFKGSGTEDSLSRIVDHLVENGLLEEELKEKALSALLIREESMSTAMGDGLAIPHASLPGLTREVGSLAISPEGVPFAGPEGELVHLICCMLIPPARKILHVRTLASLARLLVRPEVREALLGAKTPQEVQDILTGAESKA
ncbi:MAG TPA: PTS sugar transporter subunit IIA [Planctomycetes bacterium]|nr:PTS sugar transporter subunit IIA [Planctomycetota bacterium]